jgi:hypothetical protein
MPENTLCRHIGEDNPLHVYPALQTEAHNVLLAVVGEAEKPEDGVGDLKNT